MSVDSADITNTTISGNSAAYRGGGIWALGAVGIVDSTISGNTAANAGGGIYNSGTLTLTTSTVSGNGAPNGAGIHTSAGPATIANSTIAANAATTRAGGIYGGNALDVTLAGSILAINTAPTDPDCTLIVQSLGDNLLGNRGACTFVSAAGDQVGETASPIDPLLGPLADNGGPTLTHLPSPGSPTIEAGPATCPATDQRGTARPQGATCDIGSVEVVAPTATDDAYDTIIDTALVVDAASGVLDNDPVGEGGPLTVVTTGVIPTGDGSVTLNADGSFTYTPDTGFFGDDTFTYEATNGVHITNTATATITVTALPIAEDDSYSSLEDTPLIIGTDHAFDLAWGGGGTGDGQFVDPDGVAVDAAGFVYVSDRDNHRIQKFTSDGTFLAEWGSLGSGEKANSATRPMWRLMPPGSSTSPTGTTIGSRSSRRMALSWPSGARWVRVKANSTSRTVLRLMPPGTSTSPTGTTVGSRSSRRMALSWPSGARWVRVTANSISPIGVAVDAAGFVYVSDTNNGRIQKFTSEGVFVDEWGNSGWGDGQFVYSSSVEVDAAGNVYVADQRRRADSEVHVGGCVRRRVGERRFAVLASSPTRRVWRLMPPGTSTSQTRSNNRIQKFTPAGVLSNDYDPDGDPITAVLDTNVGHGFLALAADGSFTYTPDAGYSGTDTFTYYATDGTNDSALATVTIVVEPVNDAPVARDDVYTVPADQVLTVPADFGFDLTWGTLGSGDGELNGPRDVAINADGLAYVVDGVNSRVQVFGPDGGYLTQWGSSGSGDGQFDGAFGIALDSTGSVYVVDMPNHRVQKFAADGTYETQWGSLGTGDGEFTNPHGVAVDASDRVFVVDSSRHRVQVFDSEGAHLDTWGTYGTGDGELDSPAGIAIGPAGLVYVADSFNDRIQVFQADGTYVAQIGTAGSGEGQLNNPQDVTVDAAGQVFVVELSNDRISVFAGDGSYLTQWGSQGSAPGQFFWPRGADVGPAGRLYVADTQNNRVQRFTIAGVLTNDTDPDGDVLTAVLDTDVSNGTLVLAVRRFVRLHARPQASSALIRSPITPTTPPRTRTSRRSRSM